MSEIEIITPEQLISIIKVNPRPWLGIMFHHTWIPSVAKEGEFWGKRIDFVHRTRPPFFFSNGLGYHILQGNCAGKIEVSKRWLYQLSGAHCRGKNHYYIGWGVVGDYDNHTMPAHMYSTMKKGVEVLREYFRIPVIKFEPHSKYSVKTCPGKLFPLEKMILDLRESKWCKDRCPETL